ncbi:MAG TPA: HIT family protein [Vicingaceae bacterium]|nr:HIT family protein [Vicingaceae bacterium]
MSSIFTKIINGELPAYKVAENEKFLAFLDISPIAKGHTLVIPKTEVDYIFNIEDELLAEMWLFAKKVALKIENAIPCQRVGVAVIGLEVPHAHIHLVPINHVGDINFSQPKLSFTQEEMKDICDKISNA